MKKSLLVCLLIFFSIKLTAQNVGIGIATPQQKLHVAGAGQTIRVDGLSGAGTRNVYANAFGDLTTTPGTPSDVWLTSGNAGLNGGNTTTPGVNFIGTLDAQNIDFRTNNTFRGRFSALGEFFVGTMNTVIVGDLMNAVGNATFPWAVNGYTSFNGGGVYGTVQSGTTVFAAVQGEYSGTNANGAGVRGIAINSSSIGVSAQEPSLIGWGVLSNGDFGAILPANYFTISDQRLKTNITPLTNSLQKILALNGYSYDVNLSEYPKYFKTNRKSIGFLAQEVEQIIPEAVSTKSIPTYNTARQDADTSVESMQVKAVCMDSVIPLLVEAIKEQQQQIDVLKERIAQLEKSKE